MAKAKKQEHSGNKPSAAGAAQKPSTRARPEAKASGGRQSPGGAPGVPLIDTDLAAAAAASMVLNRAVTGAAPPAPAPSAEAGGDGGDKRETSTFKQLKQSLAKPASQGLGGALGGMQGGKKSNQPFGGGNQVRGNQTFGPNAARINVPRRTGG
jgi:hypothetical protein